MKKTSEERARETRAIIKKRLRQLRREKDLTLEKVGERLGVQKSAVAKYESGNVALKDEYVDELAKLYDVSILYILGISEVRGNYSEMSEYDIRLIRYFESIGVFDDKTITSSNAIISSVNLLLKGSQYRLEERDGVRYLVWENGFITLDNEKYDKLINLIEQKVESICRDFIINLLKEDFK